MEEDKFQQQLLARLDIIVRLLLMGTDSTMQPNIAEMARQLSEMGLSPSEIGAILSKPSNYISATLSSKKKKAAGKKNE